MSQERSRRAPEVWPIVDYERWSATCDTLHAHTQVLGKLAAALAPPEPELQHAALRLTPRGWETPTLPAPDGTSLIAAALDLRSHEVVVEHDDGRDISIPLTPHRAVADVTHDVLDAVSQLGGAATINPTPQEVPWKVPLDQDREHATYDPEDVGSYFTAAGMAARVLAEFRAPYRGHLSPVNAWWGSFDLAVAMYSGKPADPPSRDFITRNSVDAEQAVVGWWPGDQSYGRAAFYAFAYPTPEAYATGRLQPRQARWDTDLGEFILDWNDIRSEGDPHQLALEFARSAFQHACAVSEWDPLLARSALGDPPPLR